MLAPGLSGERSFPGGGESDSGWMGTRAPGAEVEPVEARDGGVFSRLETSGDVTKRLERAAPVSGKD